MVNYITEHWVRRTGREGGICWLPLWMEIIAISPETGVLWSFERISFFFQFSSPRPRSHSPKSPSRCLLMKFCSFPSAAKGGIKAYVEGNQYSSVLSPEAIKWNGDQTFLFFVKLGINQHDSFSHYHLSMVHQMLMLMSIRKDHGNPSGFSCCLYISSRQIWWAWSTALATKLSLFPQLFVGICTSHDT